MRAMELLHRYTRGFFLFFGDGFSARYLVFFFCCFSEINSSEKRSTMHLISTLHLVIYTSLSLRTVRAGPGFSSNAYSSSHSHCRYLPGDAQWPSPQDWAHLNSTVAGKLIRTVPLAAPCHDPTFDEAKCSQYRALWGYPNYQ